jgi:hypothetical protein
MRMRVCICTGVGKWSGGKCPGVPRWGCWLSSPVRASSAVLAPRWARVVPAKLANARATVRMVCGWCGALVVGGGEGFGGVLSAVVTEGVGGVVCGWPGEGGPGVSRYAIGGAVLLAFPLIVRATAFRRVVAWAQLWWIAGCGCG